MNNIKFTTDHYTALLNLNVARTAINNFSNGFTDYEKQVQKTLEEVGVSEHDSPLPWQVNAGYVMNIDPMKFQEVVLSFTMACCELDIFEWDGSWVLSDVNNEYAFADCSTIEDVKEIAKDGQWFCINSSLVLAEQIQNLLMDGHIKKNFEGF